MSAVSAGFFSPLPPGGAQLSGLGLPWNRDSAPQVRVSPARSGGRVLPTPGPFLPLPRLSVVRVCSPASVQPLAGLSPQLGHRIVTETRPVSLPGPRPRPAQAITSAEPGSPCLGLESRSASDPLTLCPVSAALPGSLSPDSGHGGNSQSRTCPRLRESPLSWGSEAAWPRGLEPCPQWEPRRQRSGRSPGSQFQTLGLFLGLRSYPRWAQSGQPPLPLTSLSPGPQLNPGQGHLGRLVGGDNVEAGDGAPQGEGAPDRRGWDGPQELGSEGLSRGDPCPQMSKRGPEARKARVQHVEGTAPWMGEASRRVEGRGKP